jgi:hypothetical protein
MEDTFVKLFSNSTVKTFLKEAQKDGQIIEVDSGDAFFVRDKKTKMIVFKGMRVREDLWGLTFTKTYYPDPSSLIQVDKTNKVE